MMMNINSEQVRRQNASLSHSTRQVKIWREKSAPFYTGASNRKPVFYNIQEHIGYSSFHQFNKKSTALITGRQRRQCRQGRRSIYRDPYYGARKLCHNIAAIYCCVCHRPKEGAISISYFPVIILYVSIISPRILL